MLETAEYGADLHRRSSFFGDLDGDGELDVGLWRDEGLSVIYRGAEGLGQELGELFLAGYPAEAATDIDGDGRILYNEFVRVIMADDIFRP